MSNLPEYGNCYNCYHAKWKFQLDSRSHHNGDCTAPIAVIVNVRKYKRSRIAIIKNFLRPAQYAMNTKAGKPNGITILNCPAWAPLTNTKE